MWLPSSVNESKTDEGTIWTCAELQNKVQWNQSTQAMLNKIQWLCFCRNLKRGYMQMTVLNTCIWIWITVLNTCIWIWITVLNTCIWIWITVLNTCIWIWTLS